MAERSPAPACCESTTWPSTSCSRAEIGGPPFRAIERRGLLGWAEPILTHGGRAMGEYSEAFVAFDVAKKKHAVAIAEGGRTARSGCRRGGEQACGNRADDQEAGQAAWPAACLFRGRADGLRTVPAGPRSWPRLHGGCPGPDPEAVGRAHQNQPPRRGYAGAAASGGRTDRGMGAGYSPRGCPRSGPGSGSRSRRPAPQTPAVAFLPPAPRADLRGWRPLDVGAPALACPPELRAYGAADRVPGEDRRDRRRSSATTPLGRATARDRANLVHGARSSRPIRRCAAPRSWSQ